MLSQRQASGTAGCSVSAHALRPELYQPSASDFTSPSGRLLFRCRRVSTAPCICASTPTRNLLPMHVQCTLAALAGLHLTFVPTALLRMDGRMWMRVHWFKVRQFVRATTRCLVSDPVPSALGEILRRKILNCTGEADHSSLNAEQRLWMRGHSKQWAQLSACR
jgi:hypothetical protein